MLWVSIRMDVSAFLNRTPTSAHTLCGISPTHVPQPKPQRSSSAHIEQLNKPKTAYPDAALKTNSFKFFTLLGERVTPVSYSTPPQGCECVCVTVQKESIVLKRWKVSHRYTWFRHSDAVRVHRGFHTLAQRGGKTVRLVCMFTAVSLWTPERERVVVSCVLSLCMSNHKGLLHSCEPRTHLAK